ncbi:hypothetical protein B0T21DRAFT_451628 [Apiosordaria backusii]|uniref:Uncharacterized protein n=1 Tax=Apiosordaria backusii TaxID=314023 RepID=A0AA40BJU1_9PEZI|nr:hypothetical protein B0T21DRAFT_451628 [Apiosordaria backusii]
MTRKGVYAGALIGLVVATLTTLSALQSSTWISYDLSAPDLAVYDHIGLSTRCTPSGCVPFPSVKFCSSLTSIPPHNSQAPHHHPSMFCAKWRSAGFLLNLSLVFHLVAMVAAVFILISSRSSSSSSSNGTRRKKHGWKILAGLMGLMGVMEMSAVGIVAEVKDYEQMFQVPGYELGWGWWLGLGGGLMGLLMALAVGVAQVMMRSNEGGYQQLVGDEGGDAARV